MTNKIKIITSVAVLIVIVLFFKLCVSDNYENDTLPTLPIPLESTKLKEIERLTYELGLEKNKTDSLSKLKAIVEHHYHTVYDSLYIESDSVCRAALLIAYNECQNVDSVNTDIINSLSNELATTDKIISDYKDVISIKNYTLSNDSLNMIGLNDEIKHQKKRVAKAKIGGVLYGIGGVLVGFGAGKVIP
jgi:hypothetical protein